MRAVVRADASAHKRGPNVPNVQQFNPLAHFNTIMADESVTLSQRVVLLAAIRRTDNATGEVRCSQELLADTAHVGHATVERALKAPAVRRYFVMERKGRQVHLTWRSIPLSVRGNTPQREGPSTSIYVAQPLVGRFSLDSVREEVAVDGGSVTEPDDYCEGCGYHPDHCLCAFFAEQSRRYTEHQNELLRMGDANHHPSGLRSEDSPPDLGGQP